MMAIWSQAIAADGVRGLFLRRPESLTGKHSSSTARSLIEGPLNTRQLPAITHRKTSRKPDNAAHTNPFQQPIQPPGYSGWPNQFSKAVMHTESGFVATTPNIPIHCDFRDAQLRHGYLGETLIVTKYSYVFRFLRRVLHRNYSSRSPSLFGQKTVWKYKSNNTDTRFTLNRTTSFLCKI
jgi:hypothetical protein